MSISGDVEMFDIPSEEIRKFQGDEPWAFGHDEDESQEERTARWIREYREQDQAEQFDPVQIIDLHQPHDRALLLHPDPDGDSEDEDSDCATPTFEAVRDLAHRIASQTQGSHVSRNDTHYLLANAATLGMDGGNIRRMIQLANYRIRILRRQAKKQLKLERDVDQTFQKLQSHQQKYPQVAETLASESLAWCRRDRPAFENFLAHQRNAILAAKDRANQAAIMCWYPKSLMLDSFSKALEADCRWHHADKGRTAQFEIAEADLGDSDSDSTELHFNLFGMSLGRCGYEVVPGYPDLPRGRYVNFMPPETGRDPRQGAREILAHSAIRKVRVMQAKEELVVKGSEAHASHRLADASVGIWVRQAEAFVEEGYFEDEMLRREVLDALEDLETFLDGHYP
ncbi:hypothetical protein CLAFUW4_06170 [Fulvia fulva]|uniref:Uncharacterized protein n=1 Tax=Passalora fulva TaxID=5499 RepID=A0A9Q8P8Z1_PASFU|nr:uncharacterized protein CLAFUR5_06314 [Fulvia fulva]KAK4623892.1 hypothetical protein CLAFUR4_06173 [Fulvia fulva]KAK4625762.1 hypothetical protein CLAFUR0_06177 [Fulvia fulva]UJO17745.1 hypothetical protein CLAFUR5_06314 [Fulvia fulva]WPV14654.1 hypothetical protein CLAFUW4_06170 [Fulvia fulva]WPV30550.1 hypothetical protein CLAFUW7_06166 [Fulvia fulva]